MVTFIINQQVRGFLSSSILLVILLITWIVIKVVITDMVMMYIIHVNFSLSIIGLLLIYFKYITTGEIYAITGWNVVPTKVIALPTSEISIASKQGIMLKIKVQNMFYLLDIPYFLYRSSSIVFLPGKTYKGIILIIEMSTIVFPI